jgi:hypothetical protein
MAHARGNGGGCRPGVHSRSNCECLMLDLSVCYKPFKGTFIRLVCHLREHIKLIDTVITKMGGTLNKLFDEEREILCPTS